MAARTEAAWRPEKSAPGWNLWVFSRLKSQHRVSIYIIYSEIRMENERPMRAHPVKPWPSRTPVALPTREVCAWQIWCCILRSYVQSYLHNSTPVPSRLWNFCQKLIKRHKPETHQPYHPYVWMLSLSPSCARFGTLYMVQRCNPQFAPSIPKDQASHRCQVTEGICFGATLLCHL